MKMINLLRSGKQAPVRVIFNNLRNNEQLAGTISKQIDVDSTVLLSSMLDTSFLNFNLVWNSGIAFGLLSFNEQFYYNIITLIIIIITLIILFFAFKSGGVEKIGFSMIFV